MKYIEASPGELLVGIIKQIRLRQGKRERQKKTKVISSKININVENKNKTLAQQTVRLYFSFVDDEVSW